ncbi:pyridoxamine 5-phosphate oxidase [Epibacterium sp. SM1969]|uniref:Pyridoxamine 5-phosphate oxidase n=1 Tax=Tritonibacter aquimaris TaxID=2663379 RepID=A0A844ATF6_9RHOB|nr:pyridoxamine 5'-phosphate oxidase family protein [Tritonibacter aquimaris]MQY42608.1 pyridoxamine 5-phosphate oxidase [Tritonibacter aquimaris]
MSTDRPNPIRDTDDDARQMAQDFLTNSRHAALGVMLADQQPLVTRVAFGRDLDGQALTLISGLAAHTQALKTNPRCSLLLGEPGAKGDPLSHPRLSLMAEAEFLDRNGDDHAARAAHYLTQQPKAKLYLGLGDFTFVRLKVTGAALNGGFGRAYTLEPADMGL